ncbi:DNA-processing protein DprA [Staphylococcus pseudoxylosus]|uniref:DNA-processing protein DprA n=1 Tax=Staphylococcus pseudoxylosus TaxID=2282419 RepID=UPI002DBA0E9D|nr:DNA-processing protein DprA [Staphylococcus pseudoxylosus]MEB5783148.1 DNA-processing protein DprA [Staphylococcus pseudoxylosus]
MKEQLYLKLRFAGLTTRHLHQLFEFSPSFIYEHELEQNHTLKRFLTKSAITRKHIIYDNFLNLECEHIFKLLKQWHISYVAIDSNTYPKLLREIHDPPFILFYKGNPTLMQSTRILAIIGSRQATNYTRRTLETFFPNFETENLIIVSGLAKGADSIAHEQTLKHNMGSIAVLGFGHNHHYPKETYAIRKQIESKGLVISEYLPTDGARKHYFPERNRLISGLSKGVFITESTVSSGTNITMDCALEQNREVYVLPGSIYNLMVQGNLVSAQEGAKIVVKACDILEDYRQS